VAWDFVELPSQLLENFLLEEVSLKKIAKHYQTGEEIPDGLIEKIKQGERFLSGIFFIRQLEFGLFDMEIYSRDNVDAIEPDQVFKEIVSKYGVFDYWEGTHFPYAFSHIFGGGYAAGYYSYKWAEVLEADAFNKFKEDGVLSAKVGREYRDKILAKGDSEEPMKLYKDFMGREPDEVALLERLQGTI
jgi:Zn-dependent oligopeptidase